MRFITHAFRLLVLPLVRRWARVFIERRVLPRLTREHRGLTDVNSGPLVELSDRTMADLQADNKYEKRDEQL